MENDGWIGRWYSKAERIEVRSDYTGSVRCDMEDGRVVGIHDVEGKNAERQLMNGFTNRTSVVNTLKKRKLWDDSQEW